jgi:Protein of unknown function (DUF2637)
VKSDRFPLAVLLGAVALIAAVAFAVSAHGLYDFGQRVMGLPGIMAAGVPIILDAGQLAAIAAAFLNRGKPLHVRFYMWTAMALTVALSMTGNAWDAHVRDLTRAGVYATMIAPALLALFAHVIVITWRHREPAVAVQPEKAEVRERQPRPAKSVNGKVDPAEVRRLQAQRWTQKRVAKELDTTVRTVSRYWDKKQPKPELVPSLNGDAA